MKIIIRHAFIPALFFMAASCNKHISSKSTGSTTGDSTSTPQDSLFAWQKITIPQQITDIWFTSASTGFIIAGTGQTGNIFESADSGKTWVMVAGTQSQGMINLYFLDTQNGFAQGANQLQITSDGGNTWRLKQLASSQGLNFQFTSPSTGYYNDADEGLYKTTDTGNSWHGVLPGTNGTTAFVSYFIDSTTGFTVDGHGDQYGTVDQGQTWQPNATNLTTLLAGVQASFTCLQFLDSLNGFYACRGGVFKTTNGGTSWTNIYGSGGQLNILKFLDPNTGYYKSDSAIYKTVNGGITWSTSCRITGDILTGMHFINSGTGWACSLGGAVLRLTP